ncbi:class I SAM-dependent methyltransferase [Paenibacillus anaericanus]|uniref:Class I SAM-dependent methyltransferase n=1 Tax=Paenibacillus anaericanus TaxID=170367 RepID=A0A433Y3U6_9BACL|nr:class I SAM-dependent methyltransferase [Paenibacillus anaericanus]RUT42874.1 class I SAM-dependent methyltransferase [Paenibacillus anaericanus]
MEFTGERFILGKAGGGIETEHLHRYHSLLEMSAGKTILDAACGEGFGAALLATKAKSVWGIDISDEAISYAKKNYHRYNLNYKQGSIEKLEFEDNYFDIVVSFETIEHVDELVQEQFLKEVARVLKTDGILVISTPDKYLHSDLPNHINPFHVKEFYFNEFEKYLKRNFENIEFFNQTIDNYGLIVNYDKRLKDNIKLINSGDSDKYGKYIIAVCSNTDIPDKYVLNSLFEKKDELENKTILDGDYLQIYWDNNKEFIEYNSVNAAYKYSNEFQTLGISLPKDTFGRLRVDIGNRPAIIQLKKEMILKDNNGATLQEIKILNTEGIVRLNDEDDSFNFVSMSNDPQIILDYVIQEERENLKIYIDIKVLEFSFDICLDKFKRYFEV